jgi:hypothetical protein
VDFVASVSAMETRFLSPPEIPRTKAYTHLLGGLISKFKNKKTYVSNQSVARVRNPKHLQQSSNNDWYIALLMLLGLVQQREVESLFHSESGKMLVIFLIVIDLAPVVLNLLRCRNTAVRDLALDTSECSSLVGNSLQKCAASTSWSSKNQ